jgi:hypothetical protein
MNETLAFQFAITSASKQQQQLREKHKSCNFTITTASKQERENATVP